MAYGDKRDYKKIDIYHRVSGAYLASTNMARTLKEARERAAGPFGTTADKLRAVYA